MKKSFIFACVAAATMMFASCEKMDVINDGNVALHQEIEVNAMIAGDVIGTKAGSDVTNTLNSNFKSFYMKGWTGTNATDKAKSDAAAFLTENYAKNTASKWVSGTLKTDGTLDKANDEVYYWSKGTDYKFIAIAENDVAVTKFAKSSKTEFATAVLTITDYAIPTCGDVNPTGYSASPKTGGIYSAPSSVTLDDPVAAYVKYDAKENYNDVSLTFNHILSRVGVAVSYDAGTKHHLSVKVLGYEFRGVGVKASATIDTKDGLKWAAKASQTTGSVRDNRYTATGDGKCLAYTSATANGIKYDGGWKQTWCNVIPGENIATELVIKVAFYDDDKNYIDTRYLTAAPTNATSLTKYEAGKQYLYTVTIKQNGGDKTGGTDGNDNDLSDYEIDINSVSVTAWSDATGGSLEFKK